MAMNICPMCKGWSILFFAMNDMKKGEYGWCRNVPCTLCAQTGSIDDEAMIKFGKWAALQDTTIQFGSVAWAPEEVSGLKGGD